MTTTTRPGWNYAGWNREDWEDIMAEAESTANEAAQLDAAEAACRRHGLDPRAIDCDGLTAELDHDEDTDTYRLPSDWTAERIAREYPAAQGWDWNDHDTDNPGPVFCHCGRRAAFGEDECGFCLTYLHDDDDDADAEPDEAPDCWNPFFYAK